MKIPKGAKCTNINAMEVIKWLNSLDYDQKEMMIKTIINGVDFSFGQLYNIAQYILELEDNSREINRKVFPYDMAKAVQPEPEKFTIPVTVKIKSMTINEKTINLELQPQDIPFFDDVQDVVNDKPINIEIPFSQRILQDLNIGGYYRLIIESR